MELTKRLEFHELLADHCSLTMLMPCCDYHSAREFMAAQYALALMPSTQEFLNEVERTARL
jgi:hypothetical protein